MTGKATYWIGTLIILAGAVLSWVGWLDEMHWLTFISSMIILVGAVFLLVTRGGRT